MLLTLRHCYLWSRVMQVMKPMSITIRILSPHLYTFLLPFLSTFASAQSSRKYTKQSAVYANRSPMMLLLTFATYSESFKASGSLRSLMFPGLETGQIHGCSTIIVECNTNYSIQLTAIVSLTVL